MVIIFQMGENFWIESFFVPRANVAAGGGASVTLTMERTGDIVGVNMAIDHALGVTPSTEIAIAIRNTDTTVIVYGTRTSALQLRKTNANAADQIFGAEIIVFLRKSNG